MTLYELSDTYTSFFNAVEAGEIPEEAIEDTLEGIQGEFTLKADNVACYIKSLKAEAEAIRNEEIHLAQRRKAKKNYAERLKDYLANCMAKTEKNKIETARNKLSLRNTKSVYVEDVNVLPPDFVKIERSAKKSEIKKALESGQEISGCEIRASTSLVIK